MDGDDKRRPGRFVALQKYRGTGHRPKRSGRPTAPEMYRAPEQPLRAQVPGTQVFVRILRYPDRQLCSTCFQEGPVIKALLQCTEVDFNHETWLRGI